MDLTLNAPSGAEAKDAIRYAEAIKETGRAEQLATFLCKKVEVKDESVTIRLARNVGVEVNRTTLSNMKAEKKTVHERNLYVLNIIENQGLTLTAEQVANSLKQCRFPVKQDDLAKLDQLLPRPSPVAPTVTLEERAFEERVLPPAVPTGQELAPSPANLMDESQAVPDELSEVESEPEDMELSEESVSFDDIATRTRRATMFAKFLCNNFEIKDSSIALRIALSVDVGIDISAMQAAGDSIEDIVMAIFMAIEHKGHPLTEAMILSSLKKGKIEISTNTVSELNKLFKALFRVTLSPEEDTLPQVPMGEQAAASVAEYPKTTDQHQVTYKPYNQYSGPILYSESKKSVIGEEGETEANKMKGINIQVGGTEANIYRGDMSKPHYDVLSGEFISDPKYNVDGTLNSRGRNIPNINSWQNIVSFFLNDVQAEGLQRIYIINDDQVIAEFLFNGKVHISTGPANLMSQPKETVIAMSQMTSWQVTLGFPNLLDTVTGVQRCRNKFKAVKAKNNQWITIRGALEADADSLFWSISQFCDQTRYFSQTVWPTAVPAAPGAFSGTGQKTGLNPFRPIKTTKIHTLNL